MKASAGRVLMLVENCFPADTRVRNEAFTLARNGFSVAVIALQKAGEPRHEIVGGVSVYRVPRLTVFEKLPERKRSFIGALVNKVRVVAGVRRGVTSTSRAPAGHEHIHRLQGGR